MIPTGRLCGISLQSKYHDTHVQLFALREQLCWQPLFHNSWLSMARFQ